MKPISPVIPGVEEIVMGAGQPEYQPLPTCVVKDEQGRIVVISRWRLTLRERLRLLWHGDIWLEQMTFGNLLQPQMLLIYPPEINK